MSNSEMEEILYCRECKEGTWTVLLFQELGTWFDKDPDSRFCEFCGKEGTPVGE